MSEPKPARWPRTVVLVAVVALPVVAGVATMLANDPEPPRLPGHVRVGESAPGGAPAVPPSGAPVPTGTPPPTSTAPGTTQLPPPPPVDDDDGDGDSDDPDDANDPDDDPDDDD